jgi:NADPH-dependent 2,4-dienoyl-CoA reductase/sulfur reductase-like enzyme
MKEVVDVNGLSERYDIVVVGAGPAGLAAAIASAELGASTLVLDENAGPGGQIYRAVTSTPITTRATLGADYWRGAGLVSAFEASAAAYARGATVWSVAPAFDEAGTPEGHEIGVSLRGAARLIQAREVILATGALERPFPILGWTLPGVMTAGAAQIALKSSGLVPDGRVVVAGCGPLLYLLTEQLRAAGANIVALLETTPHLNWGHALRHFPDFIRSPYLAKGLKLLWGAHRGLRVVGGVTEVQAVGNGRLNEVVFRRGRKEERLSCDLLLLHQGVVPNINLSNATGCAHDWDDGQLAWTPRVNEWFLSTVPGVSIAGDGAGIAGAESAPLRGRLAALAASERLGLIAADERDRRAGPVRAELARASRGRRFLDALYQPAKAFRVPADDDVLVCRCEEVTAGKVRETVALGVVGPNQMKSFLRCGMGPCQGRLCGLTVTEMIADTRGVPPAEVGYYRLRPPVKPVTLAELAALPKTEAARKAVVR